MVHQQATLDLLMNDFVAFVHHTQAVKPRVKTGFVGRMNKYARYMGSEHATTKGNTIDLDPSQWRRT